MLADLRVHSLVPAATPESIYGDKLVALAKRPYLKMRDFFDLWWLRTQMNVRLSDDALLATMRRSAACYDYSDAQIAEGCQKLLTYPPETAGDIRSNLVAFLPPRVYEQYQVIVDENAGDAFDQMYAHAMSEVSRLHEAIGAKVSLEVMA